MSHDADQAPIRVAKEWLTGDVLSPEEQNLMYPLASERLVTRAVFTPEQAAMAVCVARSFDAQESASALGIAPFEVEGQLNDLYGRYRRYSNEILVTRLVVQWGLRQLIVRSLQFYEPDQQISKHWKRSQTLMRGRYTNRIKLFGLNKQEEKAAMHSIQDLIDDSAPEHLDHAYTKTGSNDSVSLIHRLYGIS